MQIKRLALPPAAIGKSLLLLALFFLIAGCEEKPEGYYEHDDGFSLLFPPDWHYEENVAGASVVAWKGERNEKSPTITVVTKELPTEATNANFADLNFRELAAIKGSFIQGDVRIPLDGDTVASRVYVYQIGGKWRQGLLTSIVSGDGRGYVLNCSSSPEKYQGDKDEYMKILATFKRK